MSLENKTRLAVLIGAGGRLPAILAGTQRPASQAAIKLVLSYKKESPGLDWARAQSLEALYWRWPEWREQGATREQYDSALADLLEHKGIELVVLAGWGLLLSAGFLKKFPGRIINIHPALLSEKFEPQVELENGRKMPVFRGNNAIQLALNDGASTTGCTVHYVTAEMDAGPIILKQEIPVLAGDTVASLAERIHAAEDEILPEAIELAIERLKNNR